jgi:membrane protease YdiL (CAAX protease family)
MLAGALVPAARPAAAVAIVAGWVALWVLRHPASIAWAAVLPLAVTLVWPWVLGLDAPLGDPACRDVLSVIALRRLIVAAVGLGLVAGLAAAHGSGTQELGLRRPTAFEAAAAGAGCVALVIAGLVVGPAVARPFFGELDFPVPPQALVPAVLFGVANGVLEEVLYRGAMQAWLARVAPLWLAIGFQGLVFGVVHAGPEVLALLPVHIALLTAVGVGGGLVRWKLGSLWIPIGIHVGADIALYVGLACRAAA